MAIHAGTIDTIVATLTFTACIWADKKIDAATHGASGLAVIDRLMAH